MRLAEKRCRPCKGTTPPLKEGEIQKQLSELSGWSLTGGHLKKNFQFKNFQEAMKFLNHMAEIAETENHHPDFSVHYNQVEVEIWTHAIDGLSENDFILAAKLEEIKFHENT